MNKKINNLIIDSILLALLIVASKISIYTNFVPFTLQLLIVMIIVLLVDYKNAFIILSVYLVIGLCGIPVFSSLTSGFVILTSPTFGFVLGFVIVGLVIPFFKKRIRINNEFLLNLFCTIIGLFIDYFFGFFYALFLYKVLMILDTQITVINILINFIIIFIPFDLIKCIIASIIVKKLSKTNIIRGL